MKQREEEQLESFVGDLIIAIILILLAAATWMGLKS
jgi:hypothetical protein